MEMPLHSERLLEHFKNPRNAGHLPPPAVTIDVSNPVCGDLLRLSARFEAGKVTEVRYQVRGCTASIAAGSALTEWMQGKSRLELTSLSAAAIDEMLGGLEPATKHAAALCLDGLKSLLASLPG
jgi:nitrogen fixation NifU-like protein